MEGLDDDRLDALLEDVTDALKEVVSSIEELVQQQEPNDVKKRLEKNNTRLQEVLNLIGYKLFLLLLNERTTHNSVVMYCTMNLFKASLVLGSKCWQR